MSAREKYVALCPRCWYDYPRFKRRESKRPVLKCRKCKGAIVVNHRYAYPRSPSPTEQLAALLREADDAVHVSVNVYEWKAALLLARGVSVRGAVPQEEK